MKMLSKKNNYPNDSYYILHQAYVQSEYNHLSHRHIHSHDYYIPKRCGFVDLLKRPWLCIIHNEIV